MVPKASGSYSRLRRRGREAEQLALQLVASGKQFTAFEPATAQAVEAGIGGLLNALVFVLAGGAVQLPAGGGPALLAAVPPPP